MKRILAVLIIFCAHSMVQSQTIIAPGEVSGTWVKKDSPFQITGNIHIPKDSTLRIEPGVKVEFQGHFEMKVMGQLLAEGTRIDTILFTVNDTTGFANPDTSSGGWYGIRLYDGDPLNDSTKLAYCRLEYGKAIGSGWFLNAGGALCIIDFDKVHVRNCLFINNKAGGPSDQSPAGGAVHLAWSDATFIENTFMNNNAHAGGAIQFHESDPVFINNHFSNNRCVWDGGAISSGGGSSPSFYGDVLMSNHSDTQGGGMNLGGPAKVRLEKVTVAHNTANWAGGIGVQSCELEIVNSSFSNNQATWLGGGIAADGSKLFITETSFEGDSALFAGGGIHTWQGSLQLKEVSFSENSAGTGGAVNSDWSELDIKNVEFHSNRAVDMGGAMHVFNSHMLIDSCLFDDNQSLANVGAIEYAADSLVYDSLFLVRILHTKVVNNRAGRAVGGFSIQQTHHRHAMVDLQIDRSIIANNIARQVGGFRIFRCIYPLTISNSIVHSNKVDAWTGGGTVGNQSRGTMFNCLFYGNQAARVFTGATSGGIGVSNGAKLDVINCTFSGNSSGRGGGLQVYRGGEATVMNSILWNNSPDQLALVPVFDSLPCQLSLYYNDIQFGLDSIFMEDTVSNITYGAGNITSAPDFIDAGFANFHLKASSPAIGAAIDSLLHGDHWYYCPRIDMEGFPRPAPVGSFPDMGAFEHNSAWPVGGIGQARAIYNKLSFRNYPNPFQHQTTLEFQLPESSDVSIQVYNLQGQQTEVLESVHLTHGLHKIKWIPQQSGSHIYLIRISAHTASKKIFTFSGRLIQLK